MRHSTMRHSTIRHSKITSQRIFLGGTIAAVLILVGGLSTVKLLLWRVQALRFERYFTPLPVPVPNGNHSQPNFSTLLLKIDDFRKAASPSTLELSTEELQILLTGDSRLKERIGILHIRPGGIESVFSIPIKGFIPARYLSAHGTLKVLFLAGALRVSVENIQIAHRPVEVLERAVYGQNFVRTLYLDPVFQPVTSLLHTLNAIELGDEKVLLSK